VREGDRIVARIVQGHVQHALPHHSDRGSQYTSEAYRMLVAVRGPDVASACFVERPAPQPGKIDEK
jgi:hypothetical protein